MALLLLFIDGLGLGTLENNPLLSDGVEALAIDSDSPGQYCFKGGSLKAIDATLGIEGLPQSATGQTAIFTGINTARKLGRHLSGMPNAGLRQLLKKQSIFIRLIKAGKKTTFVNAFTPGYFLFPITRMSASSLHMLYAGLLPRWIWQIPNGKALFQDFTNKTLRDAGFDIPEHTPEEAGKNLALLMEDFDFLLYEYFLTDAAAHHRISQSPQFIIQILDRMITALLETVDLNRHTVMICSDHGNVEDSSTKSHTTNPVPLITWGAESHKLHEGVESITDIYESVCSFLKA